MVYNFAILANELEEFVSKFKETEESSNNVKRGKKIAIGGSITETTEASVW